MDHELVSFTGITSAIIIGLILGLRHSLDGDHIVAVSTMARDFKSYFRTLWVGFSWGLGHSTPLIIISILVFSFKGKILEIYQPISSYFEILVSLMLIFLGIQVFWNLFNGNLHVHKHNHDGIDHTHIHNSHKHELKNEIIKKNHKHYLFKNILPFFRPKSYIIGVIHGLAGSAAVLLTIIPKLPNIYTGLLYVIFFCLGTIFSMTVMTFILSTPFIFTSKSNIFGNFFISIAGIFSIFLGLALGSDLIFETEFTSFLWY